MAFQTIETAPTVLVLLLAPSDGDLFVDFEGDPLYEKGALSRIWLEYLWGFTDAVESHTAIWAPGSAAEKVAMVESIDLVVARSEQHPDTQVYPYAPFETTALKRLAMHLSDAGEATRRPAAVGRV